MDSRISFPNKLIIYQVLSNQGRLSIKSGAGTYILDHCKVKTFDNASYPSEQFQATTIDFQLDLSKPISISEALGGHIPVNIRIETLEDEKGFIHFRLSEKTSGTGTRDSGRRIRTEVINLIKETKKPIVISFEGISVISSSFADEFVAMLKCELGCYGFNQYIRLINVDVLIDDIINKAVAKRMYEVFWSSDSDT